MRILAVLVGIVVAESLLAGDNDNGIPPEPPTAAQLPGAQSLLVVGKQRQLAVLTELDAKQRFTFDTEDGRLLVEADDLVRWGNPVEANGSTRVVLADGSELIATRAWDVEEPIRLNKQSFQMTTLHFGTISVDRSQIKAIDFPPNVHVRLPRRGQSPPDSPTSNRDAVMLTNGDRLRGHVRAIGKDGVVVDVSSGTIVIKTESVESVRLGMLSVPQPAPRQRLLLGFSDGSRLVIGQIATGSVDSSSQTIELISGIKLPSPGTGDVVYAQTLGGKVQYLSQMAVARYHHIPFLELAWSYGTDRNALGMPLRAGGKTYAKGIGVHSAARMVYKLGGHYKRFKAEIAIDSAAGKRGSVVFRVFLTTEGAWHDSFTSSILRGGERPQSVSVDLGAAQGLALVVDFADYGDERDLANWLDARLE